MKRILSWILCIFCMISCTDDNESNPSIEMPQQDRVQTVYADITTLSHSLNFSTTASWTSHVKYSETPSRAEDLLPNDWISLSQTHGGIGQHTIQISFQKNFTGKDREAKVIIECDGSQVDIRITQKGIQQDGSLPSFVTRDGKAPYAKCSQNSLPSYVQNDTYLLQIETNLLHPVVKETDEIRQEIEQGNEKNIPAYIDDIDNNGRGVIVELHIFKNTQGVQRNYALQVGDEEGTIYAKFPLNQLAGPYTKVVEVKYETGRSTLHCIANDSTRFVQYFIAGDQELSESEIEKQFENGDSRYVSFEDPNNPGRDFELTFDGLRSGSTYNVYLRSEKVFSEYSLPYSVDMVQRIEMPANNPREDLIFTVSANPANGFDVYLPLHMEVKGTIDWGDGTTEKVNKYYPIVHHRYDVTKTTQFNVRFSGIVTCLEFHGMDLAAQLNTLIAIPQWGYTDLREINLRNCKSLKSIATDSIGAFINLETLQLSQTSITEIPEGFLDYATKVDEYEYTFSECKELKRIPSKLFANSPYVQNFKGVFLGCEKLESIPEDLFSYTRNLVHIKDAFYDCKSIKTIPEGLFANCPLIKNFSSTFGRCESLTKIPAGLFRHNPKVTSFGDIDNTTNYNMNGTFYGCRSLTSIPKDLFANNKEVVEMCSLFADCSSLTEVPEGLLSSMPSLSSVEELFENCSSLKKVPVSLFDNNRRIVNFNKAFYHCIELEGESPYTVIDGKKYHLYERKDNSNEFLEPTSSYACFSYCEKLVDYKKMPQEWNYTRR